MHLSIDIWTARNNDSYITINIHFILQNGDGIPETRTFNLGVRRSNCKHNHVLLAQSLKELCAEFGITRNEALTLQPKNIILNKTDFNH